MVEPPSSNSGPHVGGVFTGIAIALVVAVPASLVMLVAFTGSQDRSCVAGTAIGIALLAVAALLGLLAWFAIRRQGSSFGLGLFRGFACTLAVFFLIPWPCGLTYLGAGSIVDACRTHTASPGT